mmetsp:Transcript_18357/g.13224  ORF Transcript_18357/g.13224 Transcript_18357/m.13224 type:complete len:88 (+) Transcript_18357:733-996(+)
MKMDHHCPWVANCVGHYNHKFFFNFLLHGTISCVVIWSDLLTYNGQKTAQYQSFLQTVSLVFCASLTGIGVLHFVLILANATTLEFG